MTPCSNLRIQFRRKELSLQRNGRGRAQPDLSGTERMYVFGTLCKGSVRTVHQFSGGGGGIRLTAVTESGTVGTRWFATVGLLRTKNLRISAWTAGSEAVNSD